MYDTFKKSKIIQFTFSLLIITISSIIVLFVHYYSHILITVEYSSTYALKSFPINQEYAKCIYDKNIPFSIIAGPLSILLLALISTVLLIKFPKNQFFASIGIISSSSRIGQSLLLLSQLLILRYKPTIINDEWMILSQMNFNDMSAAVLILFFYIIFLSVLLIISIKSYQSEPIMKWSFVIFSILIQIPVNFFLTDDITQFILNEIL
ncbi:MAG: hypothetical protein IGBAC_1009 [Ignavibacteriae bacterium]|nr:MAG: hypothetical protein IGBAC_1009 [Ignavibacteriota bacterium]